jgi:hypothetical protein
MRRFLAFSLASLAALFLFSCSDSSSPPADEGYYVSWTVDGENFSMTFGVDEAGGKPHAVVATSPASTTILAGDGQMDMSQAPEQYVFFSFDSASAGTNIPGTLDPSGTSTNYSADVVVNCSRLDADLGVIEGTFSGAVTEGELTAGTLVSNGKFRVVRNDAVGMPN